MDTVFIEALEVEAVIGAYDWERSIRQRLMLDIDMQFDCRAAGTSDALVDALDYNRVALAVTSLVEASHYELLEALAEDTAAMILQDFPVTQLRLRIRKPGAVDNAVAVGIQIERTREVV